MGTHFLMAEIQKTSSNRGANDLSTASQYRVDIDPGFKITSATTSREVFCVKMKGSEISVYKMEYIFVQMVLS